MRTCSKGGPFGRRTAASFSPEPEPAERTVDLTKENGYNGAIKHLMHSQDFESRLLGMKIAGKNADSRLAVAVVRAASFNGKSEQSKVLVVEGVNALSRILSKNEKEAVNMIKQKIDGGSLKFHQGCVLYGCQRVSPKNVGSLQVIAGGSAKVYSSKGIGLLEEITSSSSSIWKVDYNFDKIVGAIEKGVIPFIESVSKDVPALLVQIAQVGLNIGSSKIHRAIAEAISKLEG